MEQTADLVIGLGYGDEGKGGIVDHLVRKRDAKLVVRFNGGAQAGHRVVLPDGREHIFSQFGAGTLAGARTHLSHHVCVNPIAMESEAKHLASVGIVDPMSSITIDGDALVTTPFHVAANRLRELTRGDRHGSCGMGVGETVMDSLEGDGSHVIRVRDLSDRSTLMKKLHAQRQLKYDELADAVTRLLTQTKIDRWSSTMGAYGGDFASALRVNNADRIAAYVEWSILSDDDVLSETFDRLTSFATRVRVVDREWLGRTMSDARAVVFEGAQGVLLDQDHGFHPHTTWSRTTFANALELLAGYAGRVWKTGVIRTYHTRHGRGPFVSEEDVVPLTLHPPTFPRLNDHNKWGLWQEDFRTGALDVIAARYAIEAVGGVDGIAVTHLDTFTSTAIPICDEYCGKIGDDGDLFSVGTNQVQDKIIRAIRVAASPDLARQARLTAALYRMHPRFGIIVADASDHPSTARRIAETIALPKIGRRTIASHGPTHKEKIDVSDI